MSTHALTHTHTYTHGSLIYHTYSIKENLIRYLFHEPIWNSKASPPLAHLEKKIYKPYFLIFRSHLDSLSHTHTQTSSRGPAKISFNLLNSNVLYLEREVAALWVLVRSPFAQPEVTQLLSPAGTFHGPSLTRSLLNDTFFNLFWRTRLAVYLMAAS